MKLWSCDCEKAQFHNTTQFDFLSMHHNHNTTQSIFTDLHNFTNCEKLWNRWKIPFSYLEFGHFWNFSEFFLKNTYLKEQLKILKRHILFFGSYYNCNQIHSLQNSDFWEILKVQNEKITISQTSQIVNHNFTIFKICEIVIITISQHNTISFLGRVTISQHNTILFQDYFTTV